MKMNFHPNFFLKYFFVCFILHFSLSNQKENLSNKNKNRNHKRKNENSVYHPIKILIDESIVEKTQSNLPETFHYALSNCSEILSELINVANDLNESIKLNLTTHPQLNIFSEMINENIISGISDYDAVIIINIDWEISESVQILERNSNNNRPILGFMNLPVDKISDNRYTDNINNLEYYLIYYFIQFLGFSYENFENFPDKEKVYVTLYDSKTELNTNYIITQKVIDIAKKYYNCPDITGIPLENQNENNIAAWDARYLLGDIMSSYTITNDEFFEFTSDLVISEFTLALLEDSGWYKANYYTGGLMRFGKNKGCDFLNNKCSPEFNNEFCEYDENIGNDIYYGSCSSGRQSLTYCSYADKSYFGTNDYFNSYQGYGIKEADYCVVNRAIFSELLTDLSIGNCRYEKKDGFYGSELSYNRIGRKQVIANLKEKFSNQSFCVLASMISASSNMDENILTNAYIPMCYEMFCSERTLTIKIGEQYITCPRQGGKVNISREFKGHIYCPDYNLICTGTIMCNDMIDCIRKKSLIKENTYTYDYTIETSQIPSQLNNSPVLIGYEESNDGICKINCSQCYFNKTCYQCRDGYNLVGDYLGQSIEEINCKEIQIDSGYYQVGDIYYPCLPNCDICTNDSICLQCKNGYYFIGNNRTFCDTGKNLTLYFTNDTGISYFLCSDLFEHCETCLSENICTKCEGEYCFIGETKEKCELLPNKTEYFTEDNGISYLKCSNYIQNSFSCNSRNYARKCIANYYMIGDNRGICLNDLINDFSLYYIEDPEGPVYYTCDTYFQNCLTCDGKNSCTKCKEGYIFLRQNKEECFIFEENKLYLEDGFYYPCYDAFENCDECQAKGQCDKCLENYFFTFDEKNNNKKICDKINISRYYLNEDGIYIPCNKSINNCEQCNDDKICTKCEENFYFLEKEKNKCRNDLDLRKYYSIDNGISFIECNETMKNCEFCSNSSVCEQCYDGFYLFKENLNECINLNNIENYYKKGISYFPCNESINSCIKCSYEDACYECSNNLKLILHEENLCYNENTLSTDNSLIKLNESFYMRCSGAIEHCSTCYANSVIIDNLLEKLICQKCENDFVFLNEDQKHCINIYNLTPQDEYIKINDLNYFSCGYRGVQNCQKCQNLTTCDLCINDYTFADFNYSFCHKKADLTKGFYYDNDIEMYFSCIKNCEICENGKECIKCEENFVGFDQNKYCGVCQLNTENINDNLTQELINDLAGKYINEYKSDFSFVNLYLNNEQDFTVILFRSSQCTNLIFEEKNYMGINLDELLEIINTRISEPYIIVSINHDNKNILQLFTINPEGDNAQLNIREICPECSENNNLLKIKNNFSKKLNQKLSRVLLDKIIENEYNIFEQDEPVLNDLCTNFNIRKIDIPINERRKLFYLGKNKNDILCNYYNCAIKNIFISNTTSFCNCEIKTEFDFLFSEEVSNNNQENNDFLEEKKSINSFLVFKCAKESFNSNNIKNNIGLFISIGLLVIQLVLFLIYILCKRHKNKNPKKKIKSNPPKLDKIASFTISDDLDDENENDNNNINNINTSKDLDINKGDLEKKKQKKEFYEKNILDEDSDDEGDNEQNIQEKDLDSLREREIEKEIVELGGTVNEENLKIQQNKFKKSRNGEILGKNYLNKEINKTKNKNKLNFLEEEDFEGDEIINGDELNNKGKYRTNSLYRIKKNHLTESRDSFITEDINEIQNDIYQKTEYIKFTDAIKKKEATFCEYYFKLIQLKQPLINLFSPIKFLKLEENNIPTLVKLMRIIFVLTLNIFFNIFHLDQKYFRKKFEHFNNKYNLITELNNDKISSSEIFTYALGNAVLAGFISFIVCLIIQSVINFFVFNLKKKLNEFGLKLQKKKNVNENEKIKEIILIMKKERKKYVIFFSVGFAVIILVGYLMINFNEVYRGGILDLVAGAFWTFIFLQIVPFIYCLIFAEIRYQGIKNRNEKMYNFSQIIYF